MRRPIIFLLLFSLIIGVRPAFAANKYHVNTSVNHLANPFEKVLEKVTLVFKPKAEDKIDYTLTLLDKRLAELIYVVEADKQDYIEQVASRYNTYTLSLASYAYTQKTSSRTDKIIQVLTNHKSDIEQLKSMYKYNTSWWLLMQHNINAIDDSIKRLSSNNP